MTFWQQPWLVLSHDLLKLWLYRSQGNKRVDSHKIYRLNSNHYIHKHNTYLSYEYHQSRHLDLGDLCTLKQKRDIHKSINNASIAHILKFIFYFYFFLQNWRSTFARNYRHGTRWCLAIYDCSHLLTWHKMMIRVRTMLFPATALWSLKSVNVSNSLALPLLSLFVLMSPPDTPQSSVKDTDLGGGEGGDRMKRNMCSRE